MLCVSVFSRMSKGSVILLYSNCTKISRNMHTTRKPFKFTDYDCIGFDLDNTIARYNVGAMMEMEYDVLANFMVNKKGYSEKHLKKPVDHDFLQKGLFLDNVNGNVLKIAPDGQILQASHGTHLLKREEILKYYANKHWEPTDIFAKDPLHTWNGPYAEKMRTLLDYFDISASLVYARAVDAVDDAGMRSTTGYTIWPDLLEGLQEMFNRDHFKSEKGEYFPRIKSNPENYFHKGSQELLDWLKELKKRGKLLFLITGSYADSANLTSRMCLGEDWRDYFDIVVTYAKKPGFFTLKRDFIGLNGFEETGPVPENKLQLGGMYTHGNWDALHKFLTANCDKVDPKFLYVGDNLVQDIYTPNVHSHCDTVAVCEELEAEGAFGFKKMHPDSRFLVSPFWGSYFHPTNGTSTNWYNIMCEHSKVAVPSLEYVASLSIDHEFNINY